MPETTLQVLHSRVRSCPYWQILDGSKSWSGTYTLAYLSFFVGEREKKFFQYCHRLFPRSCDCHLAAAAAASVVKLFWTQFIMEQCALINVNNCLYTNIYSYRETSGGISYNPYLNVVHFFNTRVN
jgi:hypothetical protein